MKKRITALLLAFVMLSALFCGQAFAEETPAMRNTIEEGMGYWFGYDPRGYDMDKALEAFQRAASLGSADAWYWLGHLAQYGVEQNHHGYAMECFQKAAEMGSPYGLHGLGTIYEGGKCVERDYMRAASYFQQAIDAGCALGYVGLGRLYEKDTGDPNHDLKAMECYINAAASDDWYIRNAGFLRIGILYRDGGDKIEKNLDVARLWFKKGADEGYTDAISNVANSYNNKSTRAEHYEWAIKAAEAGRTHVLALCYRNGYIVNKDAAKAVELFYQGINGGRDAVNSLASLALCYYSGAGVSTDYAAAQDFARRCFVAAAVNPADVTANRDGHGTALAKWVWTQLGLG